MDRRPFILRHRLAENGFIYRIQQILDVAVRASIGETAVARTSSPSELGAGAVTVSSACAARFHDAVFAEVAFADFELRFDQQHDVCAPGAAMRAMTGITYVNEMNDTSDTIMPRPVRQIIRFDVAGC